ncbi:E3 ubiquitin-protein ligase TRIM71-like isoform X2 [Oopsacas minuta]|uniref:E3 ubiquitin-protein ligase TRIM71-like isoform X2 n=1 Tax=Oopsacas minuta TaxID=111878 RepID=A0AAV7JEY7_9METZ|nr:E3 ubiquitin-protein ligase TRIM71-like isoform X2 [Oopsacas minuta]
MATKYSDEIPTNHFEQAEQKINSTFEKIIRIATERRDQLLVQLIDKKQDYLRKENTRQKQLADLEKMIRQLMETSIQQNEVVKFQEDQIKNWKKEQKKYEIETPIPIPSFNSECLDSLLEQLEKLGSIQDTAVLYRNKTGPIRRIGKYGREKGELTYPHGLALDGDKIYIADHNNHRIQIFFTEGKFIHEFGKGALKYPHGIALNKEWVFISDYRLSVIFKFSKTNYKLIKSVKGGVSTPCGLTTDTNGEVLVADSDNNRIAVFSSDLKYIREIGKDKLIEPRDVKINNNKIFVADNNEINNIHIFSKSGDLLKSFIKLEYGRECIFLCFDLCNNIIISDCLVNSINIFTKDGQRIHKIKCNSPTGIVVNNNFDIICVSFSDNVINIY